MTSDMAAIEVDARGRRSEQDVAEENEAAMTTPSAVKRRKLEDDLDVESRMIFSANRGGIAARNSAGASETSFVIVRRRDSPVEEQFQQIPTSDEDLDRASTSCCSSNNRFEEKSKRRIEFVNLEEDNNGDDQTGTSLIYDNFNTRNDLYSEQMSVYMESDVTSEDVVESNRRLRMQKKSREMVKETEIEDFFQAAKKDLRNKMMECSRKYNFDFEKDEPIGGRYEWVKLSP